MASEARSIWWVSAVSGEGVAALAQHLEVVARNRRQVEVLAQAVRATDLLLHVGQNALANILRQQQQRLLVHRRRHNLAIDLPGEGVERALRGARVGLESLLQQANDGRLARSDRAMQQKHAALGAKAVRGRFEHRDQVVQRAFEPEDAVTAILDRVAEEPVRRHLLLVDLDLVLSVRQDHVVEALVRGPHDQRVLLDEVEVLLKRPLPVFVVELGAVQRFADQSFEVELAHHSSCVVALRGASCSTAGPIAPSYRPFPSGP